MAALLRFVLSAGGPVAVGREDPAVLAAPDGRVTAVEAAVLAEALRLGLLARREGLLEASKEARNHLRRRLAGGGEEFAAQHRDLAEKTILSGNMRETVRVNMLESPLAALARIRDRAGMPFLPQEAIAAGERLGADFMRAGLQPRITMSWEPRLSTRMKGEAGRGADLADTALAARARVERAVEAMGPELSGVALDVCCFMKGLETVERERQWPVRSAKLMLRAALMALSRHYAPPPPARRRRHAWGADGYRPELS